MIDRFKTYLLYGKQFASVEIISNETEFQFYGVSAIKNKGEFSKLTYFESDSLFDVSNHITKNGHCYLTINTDQVLIRETVLRDQNTALVSEAFPSLVTDQFYYEILRTPQKAFVAICRKEIVDDLLGRMKAEGINVLGFHIGFGTLSNLTEYTSSEDIHTSRHSISVINNELNSFEENMTEKSVYTIEGEQVKSDYLLSLASLFDYMGASELSSNSEDKTNTLSTDFKNKTLLKKGLLFGAGLLFLGLLVNALLFNDYYNELQSLQEQAALVESHKKDYEQKQKEIEQKENIANNILLSSNSKSGFYINRVATSRPESIQFSLLEYQPLEKSIRPNKAITYLTNSINVEGESSDKNDFNNWISDLDRLPWITEVSTYKYSEAMGKNALFGITLKLTDAKE